MNEVTESPASTLDPSLRLMVEVPGPNDKNFIYCATCSNIITRVDQRIEVHGHFDHRLTNPHGIGFHVGCFAQALGCDISGTPAAADSWFMGFLWNIATCTECQIHLGWYFATASQEAYFYGLILDRLQQEK